MSEIPLYRDGQHCLLTLVASCRRNSDLMELFWSTQNDYFLINSFQSTSTLHQAHGKYGHLAESILTSQHMYVSICIPLYIYIYTHIRICIYIHIYMYVYVCMNL